MSASSYAANSESGDWACNDDDDDDDDYFVEDYRDDYDDNTRGELNDVGSVVVFTRIDLSFMIVFMEFWHVNDVLPCHLLFVELCNK